MLCWFCIHHDGQWRTEANFNYCALNQHQQTKKNIKHQLRYGANKVTHSHGYSKRNRFSVIFLSQFAFICFRRYNFASCRATTVDRMPTMSFVLLVFHRFQNPWDVTIMKQRLWILCAQFLFCEYETRVDAVWVLSFASTLHVYMPVCVCVVQKILSICFLLVLGCTSVHSKWTAKNFLIISSLKMHSRTEWESAAGEIHFNIISVLSRAVLYRNIFFSSSIRLLFLFFLLGLCFIYLFSSSLMVLGDSRSCIVGPCHCGLREMARAIPFFPGFFAAESEWAWAWPPPKTNHHRFKSICWSQFLSTILLLLFCVHIFSVLSVVVTLCHW